MIPAIVKNIVADLDKHDYHLTTGSVGTRAVIEVLCEYGCEEVAWKVMSQTTAPGFGYMIRQGATTIWERWEADDNNNIMNSYNHPMLAQACLWFYKYLGGIRPGCDDAGVQELTLFPLIPGKMSWAKVEMDILSGHVSSSWKRENGNLIVEFTVPQNVRTLAKLKKTYGQVVSAKCITGGEAPVKAGESDELAVYELHSGSWQFVLED